MAQYTTHKNTANGKALTIQRSQQRALKYGAKA